MVAGEKAAEKDSTLPAEATPRDASDARKWFHYEEATDDVKIDEESLNFSTAIRKKTKFEMFLAKIKDEESEEEEDEDEDKNEDDELILKT